MILFLRFRLSFSFDWEDISNHEDSFCPKSKHFKDG